LRLRDLQNVDKTYKLTIDEIIEFYEKWVSADEYIKLLNGKDFYSNSEVRHIKYFKASKRGNDVYVWRTKKRTELLDIAFSEIYEPDHLGNKYIRTNIISITLTFKRDDLRKDWQNTRKYINLFMKKLRRAKLKMKDGYEIKPFPHAKVVCRTNEAHKDGYIHINIVVDVGVKLLAKRYRTKKGKEKKKGEIRYILINEDIRQLIKSCWVYGFADVEAVDKLKEGNENYYTKYITKYIKFIKEKSNKINKRNLTLALNWFFHKRSFYINYNHYLLINIKRLDKEGGINKSLMCCDAIFYKKIGIVLAKEMGFNPKRWFYYKKEKINIKLLSYYSY
jgi:hypothetical protein